MIQAVALRGVLTLKYEDRTVDISLEGLRLADVLDYIERHSKMKVQLVAGRTT